MDDAAHVKGASRAEVFMNDLIFVGVMVAFFALAAVYACFCEKI